jgi:hypothetical protein
MLLLFMMALTLWLMLSTPALVACLGICHHLLKVSLTLPFTLLAATLMVGLTTLNNMNTTIKDTNDLLGFLITQSDSRKDWFGFTQQKLTAISLAHEIAANHADKFTPDEIVDYVYTLNNALYQKIIKPMG